MLYTRSSFIKWLRESAECEIMPIGDRRGLGVIKVINGPVHTYIQSGYKDVIDYEEIQLKCSQLYLSRWPNDSDLDRIE